MHSLDNAGWEVRLRSGGEGLKNCRFPSSAEIEIVGNEDEVILTVKSKGLLANMQTNAAAFEAWGLVLLFHCKVKHLKIALAPDAANLAGGHVERFLYRLRRFQELFPGRVSKDPALRNSARALDRTIQRVLNQPLSDREATNEKKNERFAKIYAPSKSISESDLEKALECSGSFKEKFALKKLMRQWPVGLFEERVAEGKEIFTGGKSAIDLIGISDNKLVLFELKTHLNRSVGGISELFFYASVMRDALRGRFQFEDLHGPKNCDIRPDDIVRCTGVQAILIAPRMHPLVQNPSIFQELNAATAQHWNDIPVAFEAVQIKSLPNDSLGDFDF
ncbi:hypothetical protein JQ607_00620 [Bradyrhizobium liaoningense]|uniref:hypothetical protein n=1 Tax=Bradyrhizobium liaoningense TaxID=43992 RepID=UPI001BAB46D2|nr:hypothetical protein [Bradyrhizobium liaoningense]MBR0838693.1 hypothetical protein [Bradyrhizobium liaoningense]